MRVLWRGYKVAADWTAALGCVLFTLIAEVAYSVELNNGVVGDPSISCGSDRISFWVQTERPFGGKVYVKGEYGNDACSRIFSAKRTGGIFETSSETSFRPDMCPPCPACDAPDEQGKRRKRQVVAAVGETDEMALLTVQMGTCNIRRDRSLNPPGVTISFTVVVSFHQKFITKVDRAYQIRCFYMEADKTVTSAIDVSMQGTTELLAQATMPLCEYTIRRENPEGSVVRFAKVGDQVFHHWNCASETSDTFGMLVHDCYVDDGQGQRVQVIDNKGCSKDPFAIGDLTYETRLRAYVEAHVFKFADRSALDFECAISICVRADNGCDGISPPQCERIRSKRQLSLKKVNRTLHDDSDPNKWRIHSQRLTIIDLDDKINSVDLERLEEKMRKTRTGESSSTRGVVDFTSRSNYYYKRLLKSVGPKVCLSVTGFGVLIALCTFVFTFGAVVLGTIYLMRRRKQ